MAAVNQVGLIGWPVSHSLSPAMHNAAFQALDLDWHYTLLPTSPEKLGVTLKELGAGGYRGANVTVPHKRAVLAFLDEVDDEARAIGAVNTLVVHEGRLAGHNTDAGGFLAALNESGLEPAGRMALVLGAGGAARAVVYALARAGCSVAIYNRTVQRAARLAEEMRRLGFRAPITWMTVSTRLADLDGDDYDLLVNTTSVGMWPQAGESPWPEMRPIPAHWTVFDLVYNPVETRLLAQARAAGATAMAGLGMLVHQGVLAFELWTGQRPPVEVMRAAAQEALALQP